MCFTVERLREHWEEANTKVTSRRHHLDDMLLESRQFDEMKAELDRWTAQWEEECDKWEEPGHTVEKLEKQIEEHKVGTGGLGQRTGPQSGGGLPERLQIENRHFFFCTGSMPPMDTVKRAD